MNRLRRLLNAPAMVLFLIASFSANSAENMRSPDEDNPQNSTAIEAQAKGPKHTRSEYRSDPATPDGLVFHSLLSRITYVSTRSRDDAVHKIVDNFEFAHDEAGFAEADSVFQRMESAYEEFNTALAAIETDYLCGSDRGARSKHQIYSLFNQVDDAREVLSEDALREFRKLLTIAERKKLDQYLQKIKLHFYYVKLDHFERNRAKSTPEARQHVEQICESVTRGQNQ